MPEREEKSPEEQRPVQRAPDGVGPLLQRDYVLAVAESPCTPEEAVELIRREFPRFSPDLLSKFDGPPDEGRPLEVGDTMHVRITGSGDAAVVVTHRDARSLTVRTLEGHMEAGRNTFGAYRDADGRLVLHIRARTRIRDYARLAAYWLGGQAAQTSIWVTFLERLAEACGGQPAGEVRVTTEKVTDSPEDRGQEEGPTFSPEWYEGTRT